MASCNVKFVGFAETKGTFARKRKKGKKKSLSSCDVVMGKRLVAVRKQVSRAQSLSLHSVGCNLV